ncbi:hypothetical protein P153DRAFT_395267 [Dothidotthia symphoricarpi CBS 119687]|uniref:Uncharacterized protein n=1 Tax=Dothidotthia symphoricarpi CBS 119687 TaxID=1392245 RepID=A0A6A6AIB6_9PLEO|nr:uncharacterized protein P153DRAFT_395267 [Dothidotthia symphoricarpi CBS 119687]KAF2130855.1 hypothetical protein P153DRAFT_395267 [Dothidotthia symphoricarpi CBS 119687]
MPVQHTFLGRPVSLQMPPRRFQAVFILLVFLIASLTLYGPPSAADLPTYEEVAEVVKNPHLPHLPDLPVVHVSNPFGLSAHKPPVQPNSTITSTSSHRAIEWLSDFKWRNPFSSNVALDENRAVLPPLKERPPIYTYYDARGKQDKDLGEAENRLILAWRRAWWAQGFRPQVLSRAEAMQHPHYQLVQRMKLDAKTEVELMRWLAWGYMGGGVLADWLAWPMAEYENPMLSFLRRNEFPGLSRVDALDSALFFGHGAAVSDAIKKVVNSDLLKNATANQDKVAELAKKEGGVVVNLLPSTDVTVDKKANGIAYYSTATIASTYKTIAEKLTNNTQAEGLGLLASLINSHLHLTFQEQYPEGLAIVKPLPEHTTALMYEATDIARNLTQCPTTPIPKSCPPNRPKCTLCDAKKLMKLQMFPEFVNTTKFFTIGTVPHPYTINSLHYTRDTLDANFLRNNAKRDLWIWAFTQKSIGGKHSESYRLVKFKDLVAAAPSHALWLTAERVTQADLDWIFGFQLPQTSSPSDEDSKLTIFPRPGPPEPIKDIIVPDEQWIKKEEERLKKAREAIKSKDRFMQSTVHEVEQWNLADTEAWKFARAFSARRRMERKKWEEEERKFAGSEKKAGF